MQEFQEFINIIHGLLGGHIWFVILLLGTGAFFTIYLGFPQIKYFKHALVIISGKYDKDEDEGDINHFQALSTALSGTIGTGNIGGVALAVHLGGPTALVWMVVTAFLGMTTKFVEVTLSHKYREIDEEGTIAGGPMYYMKNKLNMKWLAIIFSFATVVSAFGTGNMPQINNIAQSMKSTFGFDPLYVGIVSGILLAVVIIGGIKRIAAVTSKLVPIMAGIYFVGAISVIFYNFGDLVTETLKIVPQIFSASSIQGGFLGASVAYAFNTGVGRGLFSNEAGQGSAAIAHASAKADEPVSEGIVALLEPFIDTIIICTLTGLTLISSGVWSEKHDTELQVTEIQVLQNAYDDKKKDELVKLSNHVRGIEKLPVFEGELNIENGVVLNPISVIHSNSLAENVLFFEDEKEYTGVITVVNGNLEFKESQDNINIKGKSLTHSAELTSIAFSKGFFGDWGKYIVPVGLFLFAFSSAISWSYYGDRAMHFMFGRKSITYYRILFVLAFIFAAVVDTKIIWDIANITIVLMSIPNLVGIFLLRKDMKETVKKYWKDFKHE